MDEIFLQQSDFRGSKSISLQDIPTAKATGFGAAADDYMERGIDLNEQLIKNKPATFFFRMNSDAMIGAGIKRGDILIVDRSLPAANGKIIIASCNGELLVRRLQQTAAGSWLQPANKTYTPLPVNEQFSCNVWGVVTYNIQVFS